MIFPIIPNPAPDTPERFRAFADGTIVDINDGTIVKQYSDKDGYKYVLLRDDKLYQRRVHRLVLSTYDQNPDYKKLEVNHKNGDKTKNNLENLEWCTRLENQHHAMETGLFIPYGDNATGRILCEEQVKTIGRMLLEGHKLESIQSVIPEVTMVMLRHIVNGDCWVRLFTDEERERMKANFYDDLTPTERHSICKYFEDNKDKFTGYGSRLNLIRSALTSIGKPITDRFVNMCLNMYYRTMHSEITSFYNY